MARPHKTGDEKRSVIIRLRVTANEKNQIWQDAAASGREPSDFMRGKLIGAAPNRHVPTPEREALLSLLAELGKIGSNVNQIARALNRRSDNSEFISRSEATIFFTLESVDSLTRQLLKVLEHGH